MHTHTHTPGGRLRRALGHGNRDNAIKFFIFYCLFFVGFTWVAAGCGEIWDGRREYDMGLVAVKPCNACGPCKPCGIWLVLSEAGASARASRRKRALDKRWRRRLLSSSMLRILLVSSGFDTPTPNTLATLGTH